MLMRGSLQKIVRKILYFFKVSEALHRQEPSANSAYSLGQLAEAEGNRGKALEYFNEAAELAQDKVRKARIYYRIANNYKERGSLSQARSYYRKALDNKPSMGIAYLKIAEMYAKSANNCGESVFDKKISLLVGCRLRYKSWPCRSIFKFYSYCHCSKL